jgi:hypothetical protein
MESFLVGVGDVAAIILGFGEGEVLESLFLELTFD